MKIKYLGTGAAEGIPGMFCNCKVCNYAREKRGKELRTRSQALIDDQILVDFPPDTYLHVLHTGLDLRNIHTCIITHSHSDHLNERDFWCRKEMIANDIDPTPLNVYLTNNGYGMLRKRMEEEHGDDPRVVANKIEPFVPFVSDGHKIIPLKADHEPSSDPVIFIIEKDDKTLLYANDTGYFPEQTWDYLKTYSRKFDMISFDCTCIMRDIRNNHMGLVTNNEIKERLEKMGLCDKDTIIYVTHFSHNRAASHEQMEAAAAEYGFKVAYDGLEVEF